MDTSIKKIVASTERTAVIVPTVVTSKSQKYGFNNRFKVLKAKPYAYTILWIDGQRVTLNWKDFTENFSIT